MLQLDSTTVSAARTRIKFHCMCCLYVDDNNVILSSLIVSYPLGRLCVYLAYISV